MTATSNLTLEQFLAMPDTEPAGEYVCGEVIQKPMPDQAHSAIQLYLGMLLYQFLAQTKLGRAGPEWRCIFGPPGRERAFVPDLMYASFARLPHGDARTHRFLRTAPDLAVEVLSPDQPVGPFVDKILFYLRHGVRLVWVVDPATETVLVFAPDEETHLLRVGDVLDGGDVLPGFRVALADIFAQLQV